MELEGKVLVLKRIHVTYRLALDEDADRDAVNRAFDVHEAGCPVYRSLHPQITITTSLELAAPPAA